MFAWRIQRVRGNGSLHETVIPGLNLERALATAGYDLSVIVKAERCLHYDGLAAKISPPAQMIFLMKLLPYYISGIPDQSARLFRTYTPIRRMSKSHPTALDINSSLSERLEALRFNPVVVAVIRAGEQSGEIATVIKQAVSNLQKEMEMNKKARKGIVGGLLLFVASVVILLGVSATTSGALDSVIEAGIIKQHNFAGLILNALGDYARNYLWSLPLIAVLATGAVFRYGDYLKNLWPISVFNTYLKTLRSIRLVLVWLILERAGLNIEHDEQLLATAIGTSLATRISVQRKSGETFGDLLGSRYFSSSLEECCAGISALGVSDKIHLLEQIAQMLDVERAQLATTISRTFYIIGMVVAMTAIALILSGILLPIYASGLGGVRL